MLSMKNAESVAKEVAASGLTDDEVGNAVADAAATEAYRSADAMLRAREVKPLTSDKDVVK